MPYGSPKNILSSTMATSHPTIAMFNSLIKNRKNSSSKKRKNKSKSKNSRMSQEHAQNSNREYSKSSFLGNNFKPDSGNLKRFLSKPQEDINTLVINI